MVEPREQSWDQRWTRPDARCHPRQEVEAVVADLWPDDSFSDVFQIKAGYLMEARAEDGLPAPCGPEDPLLAELTDMVLAELSRSGLPQR